MAVLLNEQPVHEDGIMYEKSMIPDSDRLSMAEPVADILPRPAPAPKKRSSRTSVSRLIEEATRICKSASHSVAPVAPRKKKAPLGNRINKILDAKTGRRVQRMLSDMQILIEEGNADVLQEVLQRVNAILTAQPKQIGAQLGRLVITEDWRILLPDHDAEVKLEPLCKALYFLYLLHPEGIRYAHMANHNTELTKIYLHTSGNYSDLIRMRKTVDRLCNPLDNSLNEKMSRIRHAFFDALGPVNLPDYIPIGPNGEEKAIRLPKELIEIPVRLQRLKR